MIRLYEQAMAFVRPARVIAIALNTFDLTGNAAREAVERVQAATGLPTTDPVRYDPAPIANAIAEFHRDRRTA